MYVHTQTYTCTHIHAYTLMYTDTQSYIYTHIYVHIDTYTVSYAHIHINSYIYTTHIPHAVPDIIKCIHVHTITVIPLTTAYIVSEVHCTAKVRYTFTP